MRSWHASSGQRAEAILAYQQSRDLLLKLVKARPDDLHRQSDLGGALGNLGILQAQRGRFEEGIEALREAVRHQQLAHGRAPQVARYRHALGMHHASLGEVYRAIGRLPEAIASIQQWKKLCASNGNQLFQVAREFALTARRVGKGSAELTEPQQAERKKYSDLALEALNQAVAKGFRDRGRLHKESAFQFLRERPEFQALLHDLDKKNKAGG